MHSRTARAILKTFKTSLVPIDHAISYTYLAAKITIYTSMKKRRIEMINHERCDRVAHWESKKNAFVNKIRYISHYHNNHGIIKKKRALQVFSEEINIYCYN